MAELLTDDLWQYIGFKLLAEDRIRFRAVCKTWMSLIPSRQLPWLMLAESQEQSQEPEEPPPDNINNVDESVDPSPPPRRGFVSLGEQVVHHIDFPEIHQARCVGSTGNWLITAHNDRSMRLLNPFSRQEIHLPSQLEFENGIDHHGNYELSRIHLWKAILSSSPLNGRDCIAMAIHSGEKILAIARLGDAKWTTVQIANPPAPSFVLVDVGDQPFPLSVYVEVDDAIFYKGHFYGITNRGELLVCDIGDGLNPPKASFLNEPLEEFSVFRINYLVEWLGELLVVRKCINMPNNGVAYGTTKFEICKFDFIHSKWNELKSLGDHSLFLGFNTSVSVRASDYFGLLKKNCVYFTDDFLFGYRDMGRILNTAGGRDMGVFDLDDSSIRPHFSGVSTSPYSPPVWIVPT